MTRINFTGKGKEKIVVLGLGNILCGDDGFGPLVIERLLELGQFPEEVKIMDGGVQGQALYWIVEEADRLLLVDAVDFGLDPGEIAQKLHSDIPIWIGSRKMSAHQQGFSEVLALASLKNVLPAEIILIGIQPVNLEFGKKPSGIVFGKIDEAVRLCLDVLSRWGIKKTSIMN